MPQRRHLLLLLRLLALAALRGLAAGSSDPPSVAICVAIKDQAVDVREWVYYHRAIGVREGPAGRGRRCRRSPPPPAARHAALPVAASCPSTGVSKFYIWDTGSNPPLLVRWLAAGRLLQGGAGAQAAGGGAAAACPAFNHRLGAAGGGQRLCGRGAGALRVR